jgi:hypothetical protein
MPAENWAFSDFSSSRKRQDFTSVSNLIGRGVAAIRTAADDDV